MIPLKLRNEKDRELLKPFTSQTVGAPSPTGAMNSFGMIELPPHSHAWTAKAGSGSTRRHARTCPIGARPHRIIRMLRFSRSRRRPLPGAARFTIPRPANSGRSIPACHPAIWFSRTTRTRLCITPARRALARSTAAESAGSRRESGTRRTTRRNPWAGAPP